MSAGAVEIDDQVEVQLELVTVAERFIVPEAAASPAGAAEALTLIWQSSVVAFPVVREAASSAPDRPWASAPGPSLVYHLIKRSLDIAVSLIALILLIPLVVIVALAIAATSSGPILFTQARCGQDGRVFRLVKFRTMVSDAERIRRELAHLNEMSGPMFKVRLDPRITPVGRVLRKFSIDEIPQLVNVLMGDMTLVGPRPSIIAEVDQFTAYQRRRLEVKPGLTCLWQVSGRSDLGFDEWVALDIDYIERRSVGLDLRILVRTVPAVLSGRGAY